MVSQSDSVSGHRLVRAVGQLKEPVFRQLLAGVPPSTTVPWIDDADLISVGSTGYLDRMKVDLFDSHPAFIPLCCGKDAYDRCFVAMHLRIEVSEPVSAGQSPVFPPEKRKRYIFTVFERYMANREFLVVCVSHRSLDACRNSGSLLFQLFGISSLQVTPGAVQQLNLMLTALGEKEVWEKRDPLSDVDWMHPDKDRDLEVVCRVTFCRDTVP